MKPYLDGHKKYRTVYADPPWAEAGGGKIKRGADRHYPLMKTSDIMNLGIDLSQHVDASAHLYLWVTNNFLIDGLKVMQAWGFTYKTNIVWVKDRFGLGQYFRGRHEICLFGVKGMVPYKTVGGKRMQGETVVSAIRGKHSRKPEEMRSMIERVSTGPYLELFARSKHEGWDAWGDEVECDVALQMTNPQP